MTIFHLGFPGSTNSNFKFPRRVFVCLFCLFVYSFILFYLFLAALGLCYCARAFSSFAERGLLFVAVHRLLIAVASLVVEHGL